MAVLNSECPQNIEFILKNIVKYQEKEKTEKEYIDSKKP